MSNATDNRRKFARYPAGNVSAKITCGSKTFTATVFDESIGGLCLIVDGRPAPKLFVGDSVGVLHRDEQSTAYVRSSQQIEGDQVRLGVSWDPPTPEEIPKEEKVAKKQKTESARPQVDDDAVDVAPNRPVTSDTVSFDILEQVYYQHTDIAVVCNVVGIAASGQVKIQVDGSKTFLADGSKLITRNRAQRIMELESDETRSKLSGFYGVDQSIDGILGHEFS